MVFALREAEHKSEPEGSRLASVARILAVTSSGNPYLPILSLSLKIWWLAEGVKVWAAQMSRST